MPNHYVEDYEALTGQKPEDSPAPDVITEKVVEAPKKAAPKKSTAKAETK